MRNITDPDSRLMATRDGKQQCYNPQQVTSEDLLVIATELTDDPTDMAWFEPMMAQAQDAAALILAHQPPAPPGQRGRAARPAGTRAPAPGQRGRAASRSGDARERDRAGAGRRRVPVPAQPHLPRPGPADRHRQAPRPGENSPRHARRRPDDDGQDDDGDDVIGAMAARLATDDGITAYRQRGHIAETPHGDIKHNMRFGQLSLRGKRKAAAEWKFTCAVRNLRTAISSGHLTRHALDALDALDRETSQAAGTA